MIRSKQSSSKTFYWTFFTAILIDSTFRSRDLSTSSSRDPGSSAPAIQRSHDRREFENSEAANTSAVSQLAGIHLPPSVRPTDTSTLDLFLIPLRLQSGTYCRFTTGFCTRDLQDCRHSSARLHTVVLCNVEGHSSFRRKLDDKRTVPTFI